jgi:hypothetical protein
MGQGVQIARVHDAQDPQSGDASTTPKPVDHPTSTV